MKKIIMTLVAGLALASCASKSSTSTTTMIPEHQVDRLERKAVVERPLMNAYGEADGLLLTDGTQVMVPPRFSKELMAIAAPKEELIIIGPMENGKTILAEKITNQRTGQSISEIHAEPPVESTEMAQKNATTQSIDRRDRLHKNRKYKQLTARGTIRNQLYGYDGEINGVLLSDGSIVRFSPRIIDQSDVKIDIGEHIRASGYGTKTSKGQSLEATTIKN